MTASVAVGFYYEGTKPPRQLRADHPLKEDERLSAQDRHGAWKAGRKGQTTTG